jgi:hypothetical protein
MLPSSVCRVNIPITSGRHVAIIEPGQKFEHDIQRIEAVHHQQTFTYAQSHRCVVSPLTSEQPKLATTDDIGQRRKRAIWQEL